MTAYIVLVDICIGNLELDNITLQNVKIKSKKVTIGHV